VGQDGRTAASLPRQRQEVPAGWAADWGSGPDLATGSMMVSHCMGTYP